MFNKYFFNIINIFSKIISDLSELTNVVWKLNERIQPSKVKKWKKKTLTNRRIDFLNNISKEVF